jgi:hypothetical protein
MTVIERVHEVAAALGLTALDGRLEALIGAGVEERA